MAGFRHRVRSFERRHQACRLGREVAPVLSPRSRGCEIISPEAEEPDRHPDDVDAVRRPRDAEGETGDAGLMSIPTIRIRTQEDHPIAFTTEPRGEHDRDDQPITISEK